MTVLTRTNSTEEPTKKQGRRGATMMEYLVVVSMIVVVCLVAIGYIGGFNNNSLTGSASAIGKSLKKGS